MEGNILKKVAVLLFAILAGSALAVSAQNTGNPGQPVAPNGGTITDNNSGIDAKVPDQAESTNDAGIVGTNTVTYSIVGGGNAYFEWKTWPYNQIWGHGKTWLENHISTTNVQIGVRVSRFTVAGTSELSNYWTRNYNATGGDEVHRQLGPIGASCNDPAGVDTEHEIFKLNVYDWGPQKDSDYMEFCN